MYSSVISHKFLLKIKLLYILDIPISVALKHNILNNGNKNDQSNNYML